MLSLYLVLAILVLVICIGIWIYCIAKSATQKAAAAEQATKLLTDQTSSVELERTYTQNALQKPAWDTLKETMETNPSDF